MSESVEETRAEEIKNLIADVAKKSMKQQMDETVDGHEVGMTPATTEMGCSFCLRKITQLDPGKKETLVKGPLASICTTCAGNVVGCQGATSAEEGRRMMAQTVLQAEATTQCLLLMRKLNQVADTGDVGDVQAMCDAVETLAFIAHGMTREAE